MKIGGGGLGLRGARHYRPWTEWTEVPPMAPRGRQFMAATSHGTMSIRVFCGTGKREIEQNVFPFPYICSNSGQKPLMTLMPSVILKLAGKRLQQKQSEEPNGFYDTGCYCLASIVNISLSLSSSYIICSFLGFRDKKSCFVLSLISMTPPTLAIFFNASLIDEIVEDNLFITAVKPVI